MNIIPNKVNGSFVIEIDRYEDDRGYFQEVFSKTKYDFFKNEIKQANISCSSKNVLRGMHVASFSKLCTCLKGRLFDVIADTRKDSSTYGNWFGVWLDEVNKKQLFVPSGCAHGFYSDQENTILFYQQDGLFDPKTEYEMNFKDPFFNIEWPESDYILSEKDQKAKFHIDIDV